MSELTPTGTLTLRETVNVRTTRTYTATATGPGGTATSSVTVTIVPRDAILRVADTPTAVVSPALQTITLGQTAQVNFADTAEARARAVFAGGGVNVTGPPATFSWTPTTAGRQSFTYRTPGATDLFWSASPGVARLVMNGPGVAQDVTRARFFRATAPGDYFLTVTMADGTSSESSPMSVTPTPMSETVEVIVNAPSAVFNAINPPAPVASLLPSATQGIRLGETARWNWEATNVGQRTIVGPEISVVNPTSPFAITPSTPGQHRYVYRFESVPTGALTWSVAGAVRVLIDGIERPGDRLEGVAPGVHRLQAYAANGVLLQTAEATVVLPPPLELVATLNVEAAEATPRYVLSAVVEPEGAGTVQGAGIYLADTSVTLGAQPVRFFRFLRWSGAFSGFENALPVRVTSDSTVTAHFERQQVRLDLRRTGNGTGTLTAVSGRYPAGIPLAVTAVAAEGSRFGGWGGDASGVLPTVTLGMEVDQSLTAVFTSKLAQTITFPNPGAQEPEQTVPMNASASSGLPVTYVIVSGPAELRGGGLFISGLGTIVVRALQPGNDTFLAAEPVDVSFDSGAPPVMHFREDGANVRLEDSEHAAPNKILNGS